MPERRHYGWRPSLPDIRDSQVSIPVRVMGSLPPFVDLVLPALPSPFEPPFDQGSLGSCGPNTAAGDIVFSALRQQRLASCPMPSRLFVYYCTRWLMGTVDSDSGVDNRTMLKALAQYGWCDETTWPYEVNRYRVKPPAAAFNQAAERKIVQYLSVPQKLSEMKGCLAAGDPFIFGFSVYQNMESATVEHTGVIPMPSGAQVGGHDVLIVGYSDVARGGWPAEHFKIRNSWGGWGDGGYGYVPYRYAAHPQLAGDFWTVRHSALPDQPVPPDPPVPPVPPGPVTYIDVPAAGRYILTPQ